jgi:hypothetical protein
MGRVWKIIVFITFSSEYDDTFVDVFGSEFDAYGAW